MREDSFLLLIFIEALVVGAVPVLQSASHPIRIHRSRLEIHGVQHSFQLLIGVLPQQLLVEDGCAIFYLFDPSNCVIRPNKGHQVDCFIPIGSFKSLFRSVAYLTAKMPITKGKHDVHWIAQQKHAAIVVLMFDQPRKPLRCPDKNERNYPNL